MESKINFIGGGAGHRLVQGLQAFNAAGQALKVHVLSEMYFPRLDADQANNELKIVFDAVLDFLKQEVLVVDLAFKILAPRPLALAHIDERDNPVVVGAVVIFDDARIRLQQKRHRGAHRLEDTKKIPSLEHRAIERLLRMILIGEPSEKGPALALDLSKCAAGQRLKCRVGVIDALLRTGP